MNAGEIKCLFKQSRNELVKPRLAEHTSPRGGTVVHISPFLRGAEEGNNASYYFEGAEMCFRDC